MTTLDPQHLINAEEMAELHHVHLWLPQRAVNGGQLEYAPASMCPEGLPRPLSPAGQYRFWELFHGKPGFVFCPHCPHDQPVCWPPPKPQPVWRPPMILTNPEFGEAPGQSTMPLDDATYAWAEQLWEEIDTRPGRTHHLFGADASYSILSRLWIGYKWPLLFFTEWHWSRTIVAEDGTEQESVRFGHLRWAIWAAVAEGHNLLEPARPRPLLEKLLAGQPLVVKADWTGHEWMQTKIFTIRPHESRLGQLLGGGGALEISIHAYDVLSLVDGKVVIEHDGMLMHRDDLAEWLERLEEVPDTEPLERPGRDRSSRTTQVRKRGLR